MQSDTAALHEAVTDESDCQGIQLPGKCNNISFHPLLKGDTQVILEYYSVI